MRATQSSFWQSGLAVGCRNLGRSVAEVQTREGSHRSARCTGDDHRRWRTSRAALPLSVVIALALYAPTFRTYFVAESLHNVLDWRFDDIVPELTGGGVGQGYRPLMVAYFAVNNALWGQRPEGHRVTAAMLHGVNGFLVFLIVARLMAGRWEPWLAALLFVASPVHPESVVWLSAASSTLTVGFFCLLAVLLHLRARDGAAPREARLPLAGALAATLLGLLTKESAVIIPPLLLAIELTAFGAPRWRAALVRTSPFWIVTVLFVIFRTWLLGGIGNFGGKHPARIGADLVPNLVRYGRDLTAPLADRPPGSLAFDWLDHHHAAFIGVIVVLMVVSGNRRWSLLWVGITLAPATELSGTHNLYLPAVGWAAFVTGLLSIHRARFRALRGGLAAALIVTSFWATARANRTWIEAGAVTRYVPCRVRELHPELPRRAVLYFFGLPDNVGGAYAFRWGISQAIQLRYGSRAVMAYNVRDVPRFRGDARVDLITRQSGRPQLFFGYDRGTLRPIARSEIELLLSERLLLDQSDEDGTIGEIRGSARQGQSFVVEGASISRIDLSLGTYRRTNRHRVFVRLRAGAGSKEVLAERSFHPSEVSDRSWWPIRFPAVAVPPGGRLYLELESPLSVRGDAITLYSSRRDVLPSSRRFVDGSPAHGDLRFRVFGHD